MKNKLSNQLFSWSSSIKSRLNETLGYFSFQRCSKPSLRSDRQESLRSFSTYSTSLKLSKIIRIGANCSNFVHLTERYTASTSRSNSGAISRSIENFRWSKITSIFDLVIKTQQVESRLISIRRYFLRFLNILRKFIGLNPKIKVFIGKIKFSETDFYFESPTKNSF